MHYVFCTHDSHKGYTDHANLDLPGWNPWKMVTCKGPMDEHTRLCIHIFKSGIRKKYSKRKKILKSYWLCIYKILKYIRIRMTGREWRNFDEVWHCVFYHCHGNECYVMNKKICMLKLMHFPIDYYLSSPSLFLSILYYLIQHFSVSLHDTFTKKLIGP